MYFGEKVELRALEVDDLDKILECWNSWEIKRFLLVNLPNSRMSEKQWLEKATISDPWRDHAVYFAICEKSSKKFLGTCSLHNIHPVHRRAEFGIALYAKNELGKGYGTDATKVTLWIGFHVLGLNSIYLYVYDFNKRAKHCYEKVGFKLVGIFRQATFVEGTFHHLYAYDILQSEFFALFPPGSFVEKSVTNKS